MTGLLDFGTRPDGEQKGFGWLGPIKMNSGDVMTEQTFDIEMDGQKYFMPLIVPTLTPEELDWLRQGKEPTDQMFDKAVQHGIQLIKQGKSPFAPNGGLLEQIK